LNECSKERRKAVKGLILTAMCFSLLLGCASTELTKEETQDVRAFRRGSEEEREEIARKYSVEEDLGQWEEQINAKQIAKGMPKSAVLMAWGTPKYTKTMEHGTEKWFYRWIYDESYTLYFKDDKLESWSKRKYQRSTGR